MYLKTALIIILCLILPLTCMGEVEFIPEDRLKELGYLDEGKSLSVAVSNFQTANSLTPTGELDASTLDVLRSMNAVSKVAYLQSMATKYEGILLKAGDYGERISTLQHELKRLGYYAGAEDGVFGEGTKAAVAAFQTCNGLSPTGDADPAMLYRLYEGEAISKEAFIDSQRGIVGDAGANVKGLQDKLKSLNYFAGECTGTFGDMTRQALIAFQSANSLTPSGDFDAAAVELIYFGSPIPAVQEGALRKGDTGEAVMALQTRLHELSYLDCAPNGTFLEETETAVMLFRIASGLPVSGIADAEFTALLDSDAAINIHAANTELEAHLDEVSEETLKEVCATANSMQGQSFEVRAEELFPGFGFLQYVFAASGVALLEPMQLIERTGSKAYTQADIAPGDIVGFEPVSDSGMTISLALCTGDNSIIYATAQSKWVLMANFEQMEFKNAYVWKLGS